MITICRAEDGQIFPVNASVRDIEGVGNLEQFLSQEIGIEEDAALAFLSDGRRLTTNNIRDLGGVKDQHIFVFNQYYLEYDLEEALRELCVTPPFQPTIEDVVTSTPPIRHAQLAASYARTAQLHHDHIQDIRHSLSLQLQALQIASTSLDFHVLRASETFDQFSIKAQKDLEKQAFLLDGLDADLELISRVVIHLEFCSPNVRRAIEVQGEPHRVLVDYVSKQKMRQVADTCTKTHDDLQTRFNQVDRAIIKLKEGSNAVRAAVGNTSLLDEANTCSRKSQDLLDRITDAAATLESPASNFESLLQDLRQLDHAHRHELQTITDKKNEYTRHCLTVLRYVTSLNNEMVHVPPALAALLESFRAKTSFPHIQRLHNMLYAYGATIIEIVRRKEFTRFFVQRAQGILEFMAKVSSSERKRRQLYRSEVHGQLPFEARGMDDPVPVVDFSPTGTKDSLYSFERSDVDALLRVLDDLEKYSLSNNNSLSVKAVQECRMSLEKLINKMDGLEMGFDKIAERLLISQSRLSQSRRRTIEADDKAIKELTDELRNVQDAKSQQENAFQSERSTLQFELQRYKTDLTEANTSLSIEQEKSRRLERELQQLRTQMENEGSTRRKLEERNFELNTDISKQRSEIARALADATEQAKEAEGLRQELAQVKSEFEAVKQLEKRNADKVANLLEDQANNLRKLEGARARGEDLELQIQAARSESDVVHQALKEASLEKDRLLKLQASEHDRIIRDHRAEADGDRAVLERRFAELEADLEHAERELRDVRGELEVTNSDATGLRVEYQRLDRDLSEARHVELVLREDLRAGRASQHDFDQKMENSSRLIAQILDVAISFRNSHVKALHTAQSITSHPNSTRHALNNMSESTFSVSGFRHNAIEPSPIDPSDPGAALEILREFDHDHFIEAVTKTGSIIRKWQKQCKEYRERAKGKISFRNFAKGDLALFLPTRNSVSKPWAAFNVSFPHYFLQATGHLAEQLKTREWIVARITSITERVVDQKDPTSNPYGLGDGVKYYILEVEDWTQPSHNKRRLSSRKTSGEMQSKELFPSSSGQLSPSALPPGPPEGEVEDTYLVTHPPNSHLFPGRARASSSPTARPSSLSRLLAQASSVAENVQDNLISLASEIKIPSPPKSPPAPPSSSHHTGSIPHAAPSLPSPLRPGSRASRLSTTSRFSVGRLPALASVASSQSKAAATTALSEQPFAESSSSSTDGNPFMSPITASPEQSITDIMTTNVPERRQSTMTSVRASTLTSNSSQSTVVPARSSATATNTLANIATSWGMSFGKKKRPELSNLTTTVEFQSNDVESDRSLPDNSSRTKTAKDLLKRF